MLTGITIYLLMRLLAASPGTYLANGYSPESLGRSRAKNDRMFCPYNGTPSGDWFTAPAPDGRCAEPGKTILADPNQLAVGTVVCIDGLGTRTVQDGGTRVAGNRIDIFFGSDAEAKQWKDRKIKLTEQACIVATDAPDVACDVRVMPENISDTLTLGSAIKTSESIVSSNKKYQLLLEPDGNLAIYDNCNQRSWQTGSKTNGAGQLSLLTEDGSLLVQSADSVKLYQDFMIGGKGVVRVRLNNDGILTAYDAKDTTVWQSITGSTNGGGKTLK